MGYFSDFYLESFSTQVTKEFVMLLNQIQIHNKEKYLLIVAQDMETCKITRLIDFHGKKYDLYKYQEKWANLNKGDVIKVDCIFHESINSVNVLRVVSDYELIISYDYYNKIKEKTELGGELDLRKNDEQFNESNISYLLPKKTDLEYLSKKLRGRYGFALYQLENTKLIQYTTKSKTIKYQFVVKGAGNLGEDLKILSHRVAGVVPNASLTGGGVKGVGRVGKRGRETVFLHQRNESGYVLLGGTAKAAAAGISCKILKSIGTDTEGGLAHSLVSVGYGKMASYIKHSIIPFF